MFSLCVLEELVIISTYCTCLQWSVNLNFAEIVTSSQRSSTSHKYTSSHKLSTCCQVQLSSYRVYQYLMILRHSSGFCSITDPTCQLFTNDTKSTVPCATARPNSCMYKWRYKHSLTSLKCYEYASKTKQLQDTFIVWHAVTNVSLTMMMLPLAYFRPFSVCGLFTTF